MQIMRDIVPLSLLQCLMLCAGQVLLKLGLSTSGPFRWSWSFFRAQILNGWYFGCGVCFTLATLLWVYILRHYPFGTAYPLSSMAYVFGMVAALLVFREEVGWEKWLGVTLVCLGCTLIAK